MSLGDGKREKIDKIFGVVKLPLIDKGNIIYSSWEYIFLPLKFLNRWNKNERKKSNNT